MRFLPPVSGPVRLVGPKDQPAIQRAPRPCCGLSRASAPAGTPGCQIGGGDLDAWRPVTGADGKPQPWQNAPPSLDCQIVQCRGAVPRLGPAHEPWPPLPRDAQGPGPVPEGVGTTQNPGVISVLSGRLGLRRGRSPGCGHDRARSPSRTRSEGNAMNARTRVRVDPIPPKKIAKTNAAAR
jgi:hypothetical protein